MNKKKVFDRAIKNLDADIEREAFKLKDRLFREIENYAYQKHPTENMLRRNIEQAQRKLMKYQDDVPEVFNALESDLRDLCEDLDYNWRKIL